MGEVYFRLITGAVPSVESHRCVKFLIVEQSEQRHPKRLVCTVDAGGRGWVATKETVSDPHTRLSVRRGDVVEDQFGAAVVDVVERGGNRQPRRVEPGLNIEAYRRLSFS
jgi:hypothetical protein